MSVQPENPVSILQATHDQDKIEVSWSDGQVSAFHHIWLRDNCRCEACGEPSTGRRSLRLSALDLCVAPSNLAVRDGGRLNVHWDDGHQSSFDGTWLRQHSYDDEFRRARAFVPELWNEKVRASPPELSFGEVVADPETFLSLLQQVRDHGLCFLKDAPAEPGTLEAFARRIGPIQESNFGLVQDLVVDKSKQSVANRTVALKPHTDEPYRMSPPGILMFHCIETDMAGAGMSVFMDGFELAEKVRAEDPEGFVALAKHACKFRRHFADDVDLIADGPVISIDEFGHLCGVRINDRVAAPLSIPPEDVPLYYRGLHRLLTLAEDEAFALKRQLSPGDIAVFDNHRILHGRTELNMRNRRFLQWVQVERGDFHSTMRIQADRLQKPRDDNSLLRGAY